MPADYEGMNPLLAARVRKMLADSGGRLWLNSGYRSVERQAQLYRNAVAKYGSEAAARKWVAPPGKSNHNRGLAADIGYTAEGREWMHANMHRYGLWTPMEWEPWHIELMDSSLAIDGGGDDHDHGYGGLEAYTTPPIGYQMPGENLNDPAYQMTKILAVLDQDMRSALDPSTGAPDIAAGLDTVLGASPIQVDTTSEPMVELGYEQEPAEEVMGGGN